MNAPLVSAPLLAPPARVAQEAPSWRRLTAAWLPALAVLLLGTWVTVTLWRDALERSRVAADARFEYRTERIRNDLEHRLEGYEATLRSLAGLIASRPGFERAAWRRYFEQAQPIDTYPGRLFLAYALRVPATDVAAHEKTVQGEGIAGYRVRSRAAEGDHDRYPLAYMRAIGDKAAVAKVPAQLGSDLADDPVAVQAMTRAAREARPLLAGPLAWSRSQDEEEQVWALIVPVYQGAAVPSDPDARQAAVMGYVLETFNAMEATGSTLGPDAKLIGLKVHDGTLPLFTCPEMKRELAQGFRPTLQRAASIEFGGRVWTLQFVALPGYLAATETDQPYLVLVAGALVSLLLAGLVGTLAGQRAGALRLVRERTAALRSALAQSEASETQMRAVVDHALDSIITIDEHGVVQTFNPAAERTFGYAASEVIGHNVNMLMPAPDHDRHDGYLRNFLSTGNAGIIGIGREVIGRRKDGSTFPMELGVSDMRIGEQRFFCGIVRDITQRRQAEGALQQERALLETRVQERTEVLSRTNAALQLEIQERMRVEQALTDAREQALQAADAKAGFLANMSHEIRTPMNAVIGMSALLQETPLNSEQRGYLETLRVGGDALLAVINDILDFSKVESGKVELERRPFEVGACIEEAFDMLAPRAAEKNIELQYFLDDDVPRWVQGDATRLRQVLTNLLSNAVKFTEAGEVGLHAALLARDGTHVRLQFSVRDTGIGIAAHKREHLFKAFSQADSSTTRKYGGTGLGLAICQRLSQLMGGDIAFDSVEGKGSTFRFTIGVDIAEPAAPSRYPLEPQPALAGRRMLLVDDHPDTLRVLQAQCRRWGLGVEAVAAPADALALLERDRAFDVAVVDLHMPGMDGVQLAREIRWLCPGPAPALVLLSSSLQRRSGADRTKLFAARLAKPVKHTQLLAALVQVMQPVPAGGQVAETTHRLDPTLGQRLPLRILIAEDSTINQKLAVGILAKLGYASDVAGNGAEALELLRRHRYDLVLMDLQMPEVDGLEAARRIVAEWPAHQRPLLVAMTANALAGDRERCLEAGMDEYIAKPILPVDIQSVIERLFSNRRGAAAPDAADTTPLIDTRVIDELRLIDEPDTPSLLHGLVHEYLLDAPARISEIKRLAERGEAQALATQAHKLAGVSASLGARGVADVCRRIEEQLTGGDLASLPSMIDQLELRFARTRSEIQRLV